MFFEKKPKCGHDVDYIETMFLNLFEAYGKQTIQITTPPLLSSNDELEFKKYLYLLVSDIMLTNVVIDFHYKENFFEDGFPKSFLWDEIDNQLSFFITPFGLENRNITVFEFLLFLIDIKIIRDGLVSFDQDLYDDINGFYKPFLVCAGIFFGFGDILLLRYYVTGFYLSELDEKKEVKYFVPLDLSTMIYCYSIIYALRFKDERKLVFKSELNYNPEITKEINICLNYIGKGRSMVFEKMCI